MLTYSDDDSGAVSYGIKGKKHLTGKDSLREIEYLAVRPLQRAAREETRRHRRKIQFYCTKYISLSSLSRNEARSLGLLNSIVIPESFDELCMVLIPNGREQTIDFG